MADADSIYSIAADCMQGKMAVAAFLAEIKKVTVSDERAARALFKSAQRMDDWRARKACADALGRATPRVAATLQDCLRQLDDPKEDVVSAALCALTGLGSFAASAVPVLASRLQERRFKDDVLVEAITTLEAIGHHAELCVPALSSLLTRWSEEDLLYGRDYGAVKRAYHALGAFHDGKDEAAPVLLSALDPATRRVDHLVAEPALASLARLGAPAAEVLPLVRALWQALLTGPFEQRPPPAGLHRLMEEVLTPWREKEPEAFFAAFADFPFQGHKGVPETTFQGMIRAGALPAAALERLKGLLLSDNPMLRARAIALLLAMPECPRSWEAALVSLTGDAEPGVRSQAVEALASLRWLDGPAAAAVDAAARGFPDDQPLQESVRRYRGLRGPAAGA